MFDHAVSAPWRCKVRVHSIEHSFIRLLDKISPFRNDDMFFHVTNVLLIKNDALSFHVVLVEQQHRGRAAQYSFTSTFTVAEGTVYCSSIRHDIPRGEGVDSKYFIDDVSLHSLRISCVQLQLLSIIYSYHRTRTAVHSCKAHCKLATSSTHYTESTRGQSSREDRRQQYTADWLGKYGCCKIDYTKGVRARVK